MTYSKAGYQAAAKYKAAHIKRIPLDVQLSEYNQIKAAADSAGVSVNGFIKKAIRAALECKTAAAAKTE